MHFQMALQWLLSALCWPSSVSAQYVSTVAKPVSTNWDIGSTMDSFFRAEYASPFTADSMASFVAAYEGLPDVDDGVFKMDSRIVSSHEERQQFLGVQNQFKMSFMAFALDSHLNYARDVRMSSNDVSLLVKASSIGNKKQLGMVYTDQLELKNMSDVADLAEFHQIYGEYLVVGFLHGGEILFHSTMTATTAKQKKVVKGNLTASWGAVFSTDHKWDSDSEQMSKYTKFDSDITLRPNLQGDTVTELLQSLTALSQGKINEIGVQAVNKGNSHEVTDLSLCEGDCDGDDDCLGDLKCFERDNWTDPLPPGCLGFLPDFEGHDYCYDEDWTPTPPDQVYAKLMKEAQGLLTGDQAKATPIEAVIVPLTAVAAVAEHFGPDHRPDTAAFMQLANELLVAVQGLRKQVEFVREQWEARRLEFNIPDHPVPEQTLNDWSHRLGQLHDELLDLNTMDDIRREAADYQDRVLTTDSARALDWNADAMTHSFRDLTPSGLQYQFRVAVLNPFEAMMDSLPEPGQYFQMKRTQCYLVEDYNPTQDETGYIQVAGSDCTDSGNTMITSAAECEAAANALGLEVGTMSGWSRSNVPGGCIYEKDKSDVDFNENLDSRTAHDDRELICKVPGAGPIFDDDVDNPIFECVGKTSVDDCVQQCEGAKDEHDRPCVGVEVNTCDYWGKCDGNYGECCLLYGCDYGVNWDGKGQGTGDVWLNIRHFPNSNKLVTA